MKMVERCQTCGSQMREDIAEEFKRTVTVIVECRNPSCWSYGIKLAMSCAKTKGVVTENCKPSPAVS